MPHSERPTYSEPQSSVDAPCSPEVAVPVAAADAPPASDAASLESARRSGLLAPPSEPISLSQQVESQQLPASLPHTSASGAAPLPSNLAASELPAHVSPPCSPCLPEASIGVDQSVSSDVSPATPDPDCGPARVVSDTELDPPTSPAAAASLPVSRRKLRVQPNVNAVRKKPKRKGSAEGGSSPPPSDASVSPDMDCAVDASV
ncbi:testis-specific gene A8 protein-like [Schistocerca gregaria]|uniref:testis-specific gene A8 protein-like n=1 Tax=Schistocerca gregaria TaxID=7010 RepID=UPI00211DF40F|nr:testis-specific gene A8 protein-like [Schistocerca gregaria]